MILIPDTDLVRDTILSFLLEGTKHGFIQDFVLGRGRRA